MSGSVSINQLMSGDRGASVAGYGGIDTQNLYPLNAQLPANSQWRIAPTLENLQKGLQPMIESIDPAMYQNQQTPGYYTDPASGGRITVGPWATDPNYSGLPPQLLVSPPYPMPGGVLDAAKGTYTDPTALSGAAETLYNFDLGSGYATPTLASLQMTAENARKNQLSPLERIGMQIPALAVGAFAGPALAAGLGLAGGALAGGLGGQLTGSLVNQGLSGLTGAYSNQLAPAPTSSIW